MWTNQTLLAPFLLTELSTTCELSAHFDLALLACPLLLLLPNNYSPGNSYVTYPHFSTKLRSTLFASLSTTAFYSSWCLQRRLSSSPATCLKRAFSTCAALPLLYLATSLASSPGRRLFHHSGLVISFLLFVEIVLCPKAVVTNRVRYNFSLVAFGGTCSWY